MLISDERRGVHHVSVKGFSFTFHGYMTGRTSCGERHSKSEKKGV